MILAVSVQVIAVLLAAVLLGVWVSPYAGGLLVAAVAFYAGLELEKR